MDMGTVERGITLRRV